MSEGVELPEMDVNLADLETARTQDSLRKHICRDALLLSIYCRERQLRASLAREAALTAQLRASAAHEAHLSEEMGKMRDAWASEALAMRCSHHKELSKKEAERANAAARSHRQREEIVRLANELAALKLILDAEPKEQP